MLVESTEVRAGPTPANSCRRLGLVLCAWAGRDGCKEEREWMARGGEAMRTCRRGGITRLRHERLYERDVPGQGRRMRVSARPGEKSSDQSRVVICERAAEDAFEYCDE